WVPLGSPVALRGDVWFRGFHTRASPHGRTARLEQLRFDVDRLEEEPRVFGLNRSRPSRAGTERSVARRVWFGVVAILALTGAGAMLLGRRSPLRSAHAAPALEVVSRSVLVTADGKVFHRPGCRFAHGAAQSIDVRTALQQGYTPCVRCEAEWLGR